MRQTEEKPESRAEFNYRICQKLQADFISVSLILILILLIISELFLSPNILGNVPVSYHF